MTPGCACRYSLLRILVVFTVEYVDGHLLILFRLELNFVKMLLKFLLEKCTKSYFSAYRQNLTLVPTGRLGSQPLSQSIGRAVLQTCAISLVKFC